MPRSQLLKDLISGRESLENILMRLKVIIADLDDESIMNWVNGEIQGYEGNPPKYRVLRGELFGTYILNGYAQVTGNVPLPNRLLEETKELLRTVNIKDSIGTIKGIVEGENEFANVIPANLCHSLSTHSVQIINMRCQVPKNFLERIVTHVKGKLLDVILELEKQFTNLDELDISSQIEANAEKRQETITTINNIVYDNSITIGDGNKIGESEIGNREQST